MKKKLKDIFSAMAAFGALIYLGRNTYLLEWLAERYFCFVWVPVLVLWLFRQEILAGWLTFGAIGGLFLGQIAEDMKWKILSADNQAAHSSYWGVGIWFTVVVLAFGIGILHTWLKLRMKQKKASNTANQT